MFKRKNRFLQSQIGKEALRQAIQIHVQLRTLIYELFASKTEKEKLLFAFDQMTIMKFAIKKGSNL